MNSMPVFRDIESRFTWLTAFFRSYHCFYALYPLCKVLDRDDDHLLPFWHLSNVLLYDTIINWCKVFGTNSEECHWKHIVDDSTIFRNFLLVQLCIDEKTFREYQTSILEFRNKWVVHFDPQYDHSVVPELDLAYKSAMVLHEYLRRSKMVDQKYNGPESMDKFGAMVALKFIAALRCSNSSDVNKHL